MFFVPFTGRARQRAGMTLIPFMAAVVATIGEASAVAIPGFVAICLHLVTLSPRVRLNKLTILISQLEPKWLRYQMTPVSGTLFKTAHSTGRILGRPERIRGGPEGSWDSWGDPLGSWMDPGDSWEDPGRILGGSWQDAEKA